MLSYFISRFQLYTGYNLVSHGAPSINISLTPASLEAVEEGLPPLPEVALLMLMAREPRRPMVDTLADCIHEVVSKSRPG